MHRVSNDTFGPLVAYLIPGATALAGLSPFLPAVQSWFAGTAGSAPTIGGFLYLTLSALAVGMILNAVRWVVVDSLHAHTGLPAPTLDFSRLGNQVEAFRLLIEIHYRHYQFFANMLIALPVAWIALRFHLGWMTPIGPLDLAVFALEPIFVVTSRDTLRKYYSRTGQLLAGPTSSPTAVPLRVARRTRSDSRLAPPRQSEVG